MSNNVKDGSDSMTCSICGTTNCSIIYQYLPLVYYTLLLIRSMLHSVKKFLSHLMLLLLERNRFLN